MQTKIVRPDLRQGNSFQILLDGDMMQWLEEGLLEKAATLHGEIAAHDHCDMRRDDGCSVREQWLISEYGTVEEAVAQGCRQSDCSEDLAFRYKAIAELMDFITQSRYLRNRPEARSMRELDEVEAKFLALKGEVAYRQSQTGIQTGQMPKLTNEILEELDSSREQDQTLLGLQDTPKSQGGNSTASNTVSADAALKQPTSGRIKVVK